MHLPKVNNIVAPRTFLFPGCSKRVAIRKRRAVVIDGKLKARAFGIELFGPTRIVTVALYEWGRVVVKVPMGLRMFRKPLSLLLRLVRGGGMSVCSVPVIRVAGRCVRCVHRVRQRSLGIVDRFLIVTTALLSVGYGVLLPGRIGRSKRRRSPERRLIRRLLRCGVCGCVSCRLESHRMSTSLVLCGGPAVPRRILRCIRPISLSLLLKSLAVMRLGGIFRRIVHQRASGISPMEDGFNGVRGRRISLASGFICIHSCLRRRHQFAFHRLLRGRGDGVRIIIAFLTVLRVVGLNRVCIRRRSAYNRVVVREGKSMIWVTKMGALRTTVRTVLFAVKRSIRLDGVTGTVRRSRRAARRLLRSLVGGCRSGGEKVHVVRLSGSCRVYAGGRVCSCLIHITGRPGGCALASILLRAVSVVTCGRPVAGVRIRGVQKMGSSRTMGGLIRCNLMRRIKELSTPKEPVLFNAARRFLEEFDMPSVSSLPSLGPRRLRRFGRRTRSRTGVHVSV